MSRQKQTATDVRRLSAKLVKCSIIAGRKGIPIILFRKVIEAESAVQEEVAIMVRGYVLDPAYSFGGFIPPTFHCLRIFTPDEFADEDY
jgi:hypothetical protein